MEEFQQNEELINQRWLKVPHEIFNHGKIHVMIEMSKKFIILTVIGICLGCAAMALLVAMLSVHYQSEFFEPLFDACLSLFTFGCGAVFGLIGSLVSNRSPEQ